MKNLKKVISTLIALAISASSMVAFAANYPDVPETASYAQAVQELSALNVISGYEDGTFLPDKNVTRAEITKMIITSLGSATLNAANAAAGQDTKFADVPGSHWASGFVATATNASTNNGFIDGYSDTEFGPEDNVTFAQATKMLVSALGYKTYAENNGGWPNGYLSYGYTLEIADGVTGVSNDTQVTRAQVAQMIANAVKAPICVIEGYTTQWNGTQTPNFVVKDEVSDTKNNSWQCLLNYSHNAYVVNGRVTKTQKMGGGLDAGEVEISLEKSNNYDGKAIILPNGADLDDADKVEAYVGDSNADAYPLTYAEMVLQMNEDDEITILSLAPIGASSKSVEFAAELFASYADDEIAVYEGEDTTATDVYELEAEAKLYVNGVEIGDVADGVDKYIKGNVAGTVTLIDSPAAGKTAVDGEYDYVMVSYYQNAIVEGVVGDEDQATVYFYEADADVAVAGSLVVDFTNEKKAYSFTLTDGTEISALDLQENDVLSIAYNVKNNNFAVSDSYDVIVSRDTVEGKVVSSNDGEFTVNSEAYETAALVDADDIKVGNEYLFYLDAFGRIAKFEGTANSTKLAIIDAVYVANGDQYYAKLILADGSVETYTIKDADAFDDYTDLCYKNGEDGEKFDITDRVYPYSVSSATGNVRFGVKAVAKESGASAEYNASRNKIGAVKLNASLTSILGVEDFNKYGAVAMSLDSLVDEGLYTAYGYNELADDTYQFVLITETDEEDNAWTEFVVYSKSYVTEVDGENRTAWIVYKNNGTEAVEVIFGEDFEDTIPTVAEGTPVVIKLDNVGQVEKALPLFANNILNNYDEFATAARKYMKGGDNDILNITNLNNTLKYDPEVAGKESSAWVFGIVYDRGSNDITFATAADETTIADEAGLYVDMESLEEYDIDAECGVMTYSYALKGKSGLRVANTILSAVTKTYAPKLAVVEEGDAEYINFENDIIDGGETATYGKTVFALAKLVDGDVVELYAIIPSSTK